MDTSEEIDGETVMKGPRSESTEKRNLQDLLREEMEMHIKEGRASVERNRNRVERIRKLKEELYREEEKRRETHKSGPSPSSQLEELSQLEYTNLLQQRRKMKEDHERAIQQELLMMERELMEERSEGFEGEVLYLSRERKILVLQIEALRRENGQAEAGLETQYRLHQQEVNSLREESLQVFRTFRQVLEEQKRISESRYRTLLLEAIQDAVHLSSQNQQLQNENKELYKALSELKALTEHAKLKE